MMMRLCVIVAVAVTATTGLKLRGDIREADPSIPTPDPNDPIQIIGKVNGVEVTGESYATVMGMKKRFAEPHAMEGVMNTKFDMPTGHRMESEVVMKDAHESAMYSVMGNHDVYKTPHLNATRETRESIINGRSNEAYLAKRREENEALPENIRHKTLTEIWKKELPCECPFNQWKPVCGIDGNTYPTACFADCISVPIFVHADCKYVKRELWARLKAKGAASDMYEECEETKDTADDEPRPRCRRPGLVPNAVAEDGEDPAPDNDDSDDSSDANAPANPPEAAVALAQGSIPVDVAAETAAIERSLPPVTQTVDESHVQVAPMPTSPTNELPQPGGIAVPAVASREEAIGQDLLEVMKLEQRLGEKLPELEEKARKKDAAVAAAVAAASRPPRPQPSRVAASKEGQQGEDDDEKDDQDKKHIEYRTFNGMRVPYDTRDVENPCPECSPQYVPACGTDGKTYPSVCFAQCVGARIAKMGECDQLQ